MPVRFSNPEGLGKPAGYTHVVEVTGPARTIYIAGQLGARPDGTFSSDFREQAKGVLENLKTALASAGADFSHLVKITVFITDIANLAALREVRGAYFTGPNPPASTLVQISALARPGALLEIEGVAVVPG